MSNSDQMPEVSFSTFIMSLASSSLMHLGEVPNPDTKQHDKNLLLAKHTIDVLNMLENKIHNGLTPEEEKLFKDVLYEVRLKYVMHKDPK